MPNGYSKVTWIERIEYDESVVHHLYRPLLSSGMGFGAQRWLSTLQREYECSVVLMSSTISTEYHSGVTPNGRRSTVNLAQRMTRNFCAGVCATLHMWQLVQFGNMGEDARLMIRTSTENTGEPNGFVFSATTSVWMPASQHRLFDFLSDVQLRSEWDELSQGGPMQEMVHIAKGQDRGNCLSFMCYSEYFFSVITTLYKMLMYIQDSMSLFLVLLNHLKPCSVVFTRGRDSLGTSEAVVWAKG